MRDIELVWSSISYAQYSWKGFSHFACKSAFRRSLPSSHTSSATMSSITQVESDHFMFGPYKIGIGEVFLTTKYSFAFVNLRPVVPDVLVSSKRVVPRFMDLTDAEATDLWLTAKRIGAELEPHYGASSLTFGIQDGVQAGQTVPHVHIHILPRKEADLEVKDDDYDEADKAKRNEIQLKKRLDAEEQRKDRDRAQMVEEAAELRKLF